MASPNSNALVFGVGAIAALLGLAFFVTQRAGVPLLGSLPAGFGPVPHSAGFGFLAGGLGFIAAGLALPWLATALGLIAGALGGFGLAQGMPGTPQNAIAQPDLCLLLAGLAVVVAGSGRPRRYRRLLLGSLGALVASLGTAAFVFGITAGAAGFALTPQAAPSGFGFAVLGLGILAVYRSEPSPRDPGPRLAPPLIAVIVLSATFYVWQGLRSMYEVEIQRTVETAATHVRGELTASIESAIRALIRMGKRWENNGRLERREWDSDAALYLADFRGYRALAWVDAGGLTRWVARGPGQAASSLDLDGDLRARAAFDAARASAHFAVSRTLTLDGGRGFLVVVPLFPNGRFDGFIVGLIGFQALLDGALKDLDLLSYCFAIFDGNTPVYSRTTEWQGATDQWMRDVPLDIRGVRWRARIWPRPRFVAGVQSALPSVLLSAGLVLACLSSLALYLAQTARFRAGEIATANGELAREIADRRNAQEELARARDQLELRVAERTTELARANDELTAEIADRKHAEETLRASEERFRNLLDTANDLVYTHDLQGNFSSINKAAEKAIGYLEAEAVGMNISQVVVPEHVDLARQMIARKLGGEPATTYELAVETRDGRRLILEVNTHLIYRNGNPVGVHGIAREVTERKRLEEQLRQAQKMEAIGRLAGGVAHDFNNLLTVIGAYSYMLLEGIPQGELRDAAQEIVWATERAASLTGRLLAFSRRQVVQPKILDLNSLILNMGKLLRRLIGEDIELVTLLSPDLGRIKADAGQLEQVIMNLAVNARDAMPDGGRLTLETANVERSGPFVVLAVSDTGCGMDAETRSHLFEPFFTTKAPDKGTGLGLSTVYGIVKLSGGEITVESEPHRGTRFCIYLPVAAPAETEKAQFTETKPHLTGTEMVLLVEDEAGVRRLVREMLVKYGYQVIEAANGREAISAYEKHAGPIDLLLTDIVMPVMDGRELARQIAPWQPNLKVLYMTGYTESEIIHHGVLESGVAVIQKPFVGEALARKVREVLDAPQPRGATD